MFVYKKAKNMRLYFGIMYMVNQIARSIEISIRRNVYV